MRRILRLVLTLPDRMARPLRRAYYLEGRADRIVAILPPTFRRALGVDEPSDSLGRRVEIGSGHRPATGFVHIDANPAAPHLEYVANAWNLPIPTNWAEEVQAIHVLEHIRPPQLLETLTEWRRVLQPRGVLRVHVPNAPEMMEAFIQAPPEAKWSLIGAINGMYANKDVTSPAELRESADHQILFDGPLVRWSLEAAGFVDIVDLTMEVVDVHTRGWRPLLEHCSLVFHAQAPD